MNYVARDISLIARALLIVLLCMSCNKPRFATNLDEKVARSIALETRMSKQASSTGGVAGGGIGIVSLQSNYSLQDVQCLNCATNGTMLMFEDKQDGKSFEAKFSFPYVQETRECELQLSVVYADRPNSPVNKNYSIMLCPLGDDDSPACDEGAAVANCADIKNSGG